MDTVFALSNDPSSDAYGTTCFGQDVAAYTDIVTVMDSHSYGKQIVFTLQNISAYNQIA